MTGTAWTHKGLILAAGRLVALLAILAAVAPARAQADRTTVRALLVADTSDATIGIGTKGNLDSMRTLLRRASREGDFPLDLKTVSGADFSCTSILAALDAMQAAPQDTVLFYIAAHGYRTSATTSRFPDYYCIKPGDKPGTVVGTGLVEARLKAKGARFVIAIADTCNVTLSREPSALPQARTLEDVDPQAWRRLFLRYSGTILMSGSTPGKPSWYFNGGRRPGGMFTLQFLDAVNENLAEATDERNPELARWSRIVNRATRKIVYNASINQQPQGDRQGLRVDPLPLVSAR